MPRSPHPLLNLMLGLGVWALASVAAAGEPVDCDVLFQRSGHGETFYEANPTYTDPGGAYPWPEAAPGDEAMDSGVLDAGIARLTALPAVFSVLVLRHGNLVAEAYANGSAADQANNIHSASKSLLSALVGIAIEEGYIEGVDQPVAELLPDTFDGLDPAKAEITVGDLLTMSAGLAWSEDVTEYVMQDDPDWVAAILARPLAHPPGETFHYSSGLTHVLSAALTTATGSSTCDYAQSRLFGPLGITPEHWGRDPRGISSGGYNLYLTPREMAAFGQLYLQGGRWQAQQVVPADWVARSWQRHRAADGTYGYGYLWWLRDLDGHEAAIAWGWGGQLIYVVPDRELVVVVTADTADDSPHAGTGDVADAAQAFVRDAVIGSLE